MAQAITLARPYARAAFEAAQAAGTLDSWSQALAFAAAVAGDPQVVALAGDPRVTSAQRVALHVPDGMGADTPFTRFLTELAERGRLVLLPEVAALFAALYREAQSRLLVHVTSAIALDATQAEQLRTSLQRRFKRDIALETQVDPALLAGVIVDTGSEVIDGSARGRLSRLASALVN